MAAFQLSLSVGSTLPSCDRASDAPRREPEPVNPGGGKEEGGGEKPDNPGGERPGLDDNIVDFQSELADEVLRYVGKGVNLRLDRGGVLFKTLADGGREIIDLDNSLRVEVRTGTMRADSVFPDATIVAGGDRVGIKSFRMKKQTAGAVWYHIVDKDSRDYVIVLP